MVDVGGRKEVGNAVRIHTKVERPLTANAVPRTLPAAIVPAPFLSIKRSIYWAGISYCGCGR